MFDIKQRLKAAQAIQSLLRPKSYVIVVEHDLSILITCPTSFANLYGKPGIYGVYPRRNQYLFSGIPFY
ncbi:hypothetical protein AMTRI_Chr07g82270 [Amborella trichopoda]